MMRLIVAGSRLWPSVKVVYDSLDILLSNTPLDEVVIISGHCDNSEEAKKLGTMDSPDMIGEAYAETRGIELEIYPANWRPYSTKLGRRHYDKSAGHKRNAKMGSLASHLAAFYNGTSSGTKGMIKVAQNKGLEIAVIDLKGNIKRL